MLDELIKERRRKLRRYTSIRSPYPAKIHRDLTIGELIENFSKFEKSKKSISIVGRVFAWRDQGKIIFTDVRDAGGKVQFVIDDEQTQEFSLVKDTFDIGDWVEGTGKVFSTKRGEKSVLIEQIRIIGKSLRPPPATWYGLEDLESRLRNRYLDTLIHPEARDLFMKKAVFWETVRNYHKADGFLEMEMPVLEAVPGGADAEPFVTHHNALDRDFYLRISLELPLKKMLVGGFEKVFEIGRIFRNEGIDREHLQDYTQMECYAAFWGYEEMMEFVERLYKKVVEQTFGVLDTKFSEHTLHWGKQWPKIDYFEIFKQEAGINLDTADQGELMKAAKKLNLEIETFMGKGRLIDLIYKKTVRPKFIQPAFLVGHPIEISPLAKIDPSNPKKVLRFQVVGAQSELGNGWSELNDPSDQMNRFEEQMALREKGDKEAQHLDQSFIDALEYGMPPAAGFGMSERLFAVLVDKPIRETVFFPLMKEKS
ncbi:lysine--tRNA ligase [Candidatus Jorgensenbacteria bacterium]|nr:lysine--tRNA ligase [Candidatus Jorgensenbacteria bacterium]